jgi:Protein of unknown function (DUF993)
VQVAEAYHPILPVTSALLLPRTDRTLARYGARCRYAFPESAPPPRTRIPYAAVHVVADPLADTTPDGPVAIDWDATMRFRHVMWGLGIGVAEAMDTAQRGMGLDWEASKELIRRTAAEAAARDGAGAALVCGAQTDHLAPGSARSLRDVEAAYEEQCGFIESVGGTVVLMASRELRRLASGPDDYLEVYTRVLSQLRRPALIHWLGEAFDPRLAGYWGAADLDRAADVCLQVIEANRERVYGLKLSLLDQRREVAMRRRLPEGVHMFTGDDFDYPTTIGGDGERYSDALLGALSMIAPAAAVAFQAMDAGDERGFHSTLAPTVPLARHVFGAPTYYYKTGVVFLAYLNGHQSHFRMVGGLESGRSVVHLSRLFVLADSAGLLRDTELAVDRMRKTLALAGIE